MCSPERPSTENFSHGELLRIHPDDNIAVATQSLPAKQTVIIEGNSIVIPHDIALGAKLALRSIAAGEKVFKYGEPIGSATVDIGLGDYVHTHNLQSDFTHTAIT